MLAIIDFTFKPLQIKVNRDRINSDTLEWSNVNLINWILVVIFKVSSKFTEKFGLMTLLKLQFKVKSTRIEREKSQMHSNELNSIPFQRMDD